MPRAVAIFASLCALGCVPSPQSRGPDLRPAKPRAGSFAPPPGSLAPLAAGAPVERPLAGGEIHRYLLPLRAGELAIVAADQHGIDVELRISGPSGAPRLAPIDGTGGERGTERAFLLAGAAGRFAVEVAAPDRAAPAGRYRLAVEAHRRASAVDRARTAAEWTFARAEAARRRRRTPDLRDAERLHRAALARLSALSDEDARRRRGDGLDRLGRIRLELGDLTGSAAAYRGALATLTADQAPGARADALNGFAIAARLLGEPAAAEAAATEAVALFDSIGDRRGVASALNNRGRVRTATGRVEAALSDYEQALTTWTEIGDELRRGITLGNRGRLLLAHGDLDGARRDLLAARALLRNRNAARETAAILTDLGAALARAGRTDEARSTLDQAAASARQAGDRRGEGAALGHLALLAEEGGDLDRAATLDERAIGLFRAIADRPDEAAARTRLGRVLARRGRFHRALEEIAIARRIFRSLGDPSGEGAALAASAETRLLAHDLAGAARDAELARERVETLRRGIATSDLRSALLASRRDLDELSVEIAMARHRAARERGLDGGFDRAALTIAESGRARELLAALAESGPRPTCARAEATAGLAALERRLASAGERAAGLAEIGAAEDARADAGAEVARLLAERERLEVACRGDRIERAPAAWRERVAEPEAATRRTIRRTLRHLAPGTLVIEIALGDDRSYAWHATRDRLRVRELPPRAQLVALANRLRLRLAAGSPTLARRAVEADLAELASHLLGLRADSELPRRVLFVPDGALYGVPFAALPVGGAPLVERAEVAVLPSLTALQAIRATPRPAPETTLAVVADPVFDARDGRLRTAAPAAARRGLPRLAGAAREAAAILSLAPAAERIAALGLAARRRDFVAGRFGRTRYLHLATHALLDPARPALSALALSAVDDDGRPVDGRLKAYEIQRLTFAAEMVALSACETGVGREIAGEGLASLARSFLIAGARSTLASLWRVDDDSTAELMVELYRGLLARGLPPAAALRAAQRELRRRPGRAAPWFWAGFVLFGDPESHAVAISTKPGARSRIEP